MTFASGVKTVCANPYLFGTETIWALRNILDNLSENFSIQTLPKFGTLISLVMHITWIDFGEILFETCWVMSSLKNSMCFFPRKKTILNISQEWLVRFMWNELHRLDTVYTIWPWPLTSFMTFILDFSRKQFEIALPHELLVWLMWN